MATFADDVRELSGIVTELSRTYAIHRALINRFTYKRYSRAIENHRDFFNAIASSLIQGFCVMTYQLFDSGKRGDVKSLPVLLNNMTSSNPVLEKKLRSDIEAQKQLLKKYFDFRHKIFAHRDKSKPPWEVWGTQSKKIVRVETKTIVRLAQDIIGELGDTAGVGSKKEIVDGIQLREKYAGTDVFEILKALKKFTI
jgi:hypothetical protein